MHSLSMKALAVSGHCICTTIVLLSYISVTAAQEEVVLVRTEPSDQSPCPGQMVEYECHSEIPVSTLVWTLPTGESLPDYNGGSMNGSRRTDSDGVPVANLTSIAPDNDPNSDFFFFTTTLLIGETINNSNISCTVAITNDVLKQTAIIALSGNPDSPSGGQVMYDGGLTVDLEWSRPNYTGGAPVVNYTVSIDRVNVIVSDRSEVVSYTSTGLIYGEVLVTTINSCGLESQSPLIINIPASAPPDITGHSVQFSCNASLNQFPVTISWMPGARREGVVYPGEVLVNVELQSQLDSDSIACSVETDTSTSCIAIITRDVYTVTVNQTNDVGYTVNTYDFNANIVDVTERMLGDNDDPLSVTVSVNELCPSDRSYLVLVTFGTQLMSGSDCEGQVNTTVMTISSGDSATFSVPADTVSRRNDEEYCFLIIVDGEIVTTESDGGDESVGLSTGAAVGIAVALTLLVALSVGVVIGVWFVWKTLYGQQKLQGANTEPIYEDPEANAAAIYEDPEASGVRETAIPLSHNQAYGQVDLQGRRGRN